MLIDLTGKAKCCPLCGSEKISADEPKHDVIYTVRIQCMDCGLNGYKIFKKDEEDPINKTIEYWNTRIPNTDTVDNEYDLHDNTTEKD